MDDITIDITDVRLETERLLLRGWREEDIDDFYEYASVEGVGEMAGWKSHDSIEVTREVLRTFMTEKNVFAIVHKESGKVIGSLGIHEARPSNNPVYSGLKRKEIGYVLSKEYWGQGLMPEAVKRAIAFCFVEYELDALTVAHFSDNLQSKRVIEKCGFQFVEQSEYYAKQLDKTAIDMEYILYR